METTVAQAFLEEFDPEMRNTRRTLERIRDDALGFKPHPKSMSMGQLASHIAEMIGWAPVTAELDEFDDDPPAGPRYEPFEASAGAGVLELFDHNTQDAKDAVGRVSDTAMQAPWTLLAGGDRVSPD